MLVTEIEALANTVSSAVGGPEVPPEIVAQYLAGRLPGEVYENQRALHPDDEETGEPLVPYNGLPPEDRCAAEVVHAAVYQCRFYITEEDPDEVIIPATLQTYTGKQKEAWEEENEFKLPDTEAKAETKPAPKEAPKEKVSTSS